MMTEICEELHNFFEKKIVCGTFEIKDGVFVAPLDFLQANQYFRIVGSVFNDGVYKNDNKLHLTDEAFNGEIWALAIPPTLIALSTEIKAYSDSDEAKPSAFTSESFGGYSYSKATDESGAALSWQKVFRSRLNRWRKI